ncbi:translocation/assembly module TamB domain-containing protein [Comamonas fluminis]|uniref:translocation/assembly module TamB domain-containing protein n=1 Tax=Comamonas fluminis TaxID=2796366 RepID=UPI001C47CC5D|nr:translocation/assembly module TamB domain-containing protein [Comamonas fluminis]
MSDHKNSEGAAPSTPAAQPAPRKRRRWLRALGWLFLTLVLVVVLAVGGLLWWIGRDDSLSVTLQKVAGWLPVEQSLSAKDVTGSVKNGGHIGWLQWQSPTMKVEVKQAKIGWQFRPLIFSRALKLGNVHIESVEISSTPDPDKKPSEPLQSLTLPVKIELPFQVDRVIWNGPPEAIVENINGIYEYTGSHHELQINSLHVADGDYQALARIQGAAPMQTSVELQGKLKTPNPLQAKSENSTGKPADLIDVLANAQIKGTLATEAAELKITAHAEAAIQAADSQNQEQASQESKPSEAKPAKNPATDKRKPLEKSERPAAYAPPMLADIQAAIAPWKPQPLLSAQAMLKNLDVAAFWPQGPRTALSGELQAGPGPVQQADSASTVGQSPEPGTPSQPSWALRTQFSNTLPGPWDKQRLPVQNLQAQVRFNNGQWLVDEALIDIGKGQINLGGNFIPSAQIFEGELKVKQLNPADLYSSLEAAPLDGSLEAHTLTPPVPVNPAEADEKPAMAVAFSADLHAAGKPTGKALRIQTLATKGQWQTPLLQLETLKLDALQANIDAKAIEFNTETQQAKAQLKAMLPGAQLQLAGHMAPKDGQGNATLQLSSLNALTQWLGRLPGMKNPLGGARLDGAAQAQLDWRGGWGGLLQRLNAAPGAALPASGLQLNAAVQSDQIRYQAADAAADQALRLSGMQLKLNGSPENARLTLAALAQQADKSVQLDTALQAGLASGKGAAPLDWQASLEKLQAQLKLGKDKPGPWALQLQPGAPVQITQHTSGKTVLNTAWQISAGKLQITPPRGNSNAAGQSSTLPAALLEWDGSNFTKAGNGQFGLRSTGRAQGIPLAWVDAFSLGDDEPPLQAAGLSGDLSFNGRWDVDTMGRNLKAELLVERAAGDLRLAVDDGGSGTTVIQTTGPTAKSAGGTRTRTINGAGMRARIKQAKLSVRAEGSNVTTQLIWDSERAGTAQADLRTQLSYGKDGWMLPPNAPLSGKVHASMPDIGIWGLFAPPGWRVKGTLAADATISGTLNDPQWQGNINADALNIASLLDGVDLQDGVLRAKLQGTRLDITEFRIKGGKGSNTRILGYSGNLTSAPTEGGSLVGSGYAQFTPPGQSGEPGLSMHLQAKASKLQVLVRADRQVSVSGDLTASLLQGQFTLRGDLTVDRASIILPEESAPSLDKDVVVHSAASRKAAEEARLKQERADRKEQARATPRKLPDILVKLNMGRDFALQGFGITTRLRGNLEVKGASYLGGPPSVTGEIRTEQGRYRAWGQSLDVDNGLIRFNGPMANPSLDILALRPNITVKAGVQVLGTASAPRVLLYSDPDLPDAEKLSWVVMGRDPTTGGASSALLQQAAMALLAGGNSSSGKIAGSLGLDEVGFKGGSDGDAAGAALTMGKRLSDKLYLTYEQSLSGAMGIIYIFYDLSRNLTLRAQTGVTSALDLVYTVRKD